MFNIFKRWWANTTYEYITNQYLAEVLLSKKKAVSYIPGDAYSQYLCLPSKASIGLVNWWFPLVVILSLSFRQFWRPNFREPFFKANLWWKKRKSEKGWLLISYIEFEKNKRFFFLTRRKQGINDNRFWLSWLNCSNEIIYLFFSVESADNCLAIAGLFKSTVIGWVA